MMKWAIRTGVHVDRAGCVWLIRRMIDPDAVFVFVDAPADIPADAIAFDMPRVDLSHHGPDCTAETILRRYEIQDPVAWKVAEIIHEADLEDFGQPALGQTALQRPGHVAETQPPRHLQPHRRAPDPPRHGRPEPRRPQGHRPTLPHTEQHRPSGEAAGRIMKAALAAALRPCGDLRV
jgi:hypothetical protein